MLGEQKMRVSESARLKSQAFEAACLDEVGHFEDLVDGFGRRRTIVPLPLLLLEELIVEVLVSNARRHPPDFFLLELASLALGYLRRAFLCNLSLKLLDPFLRRYVLFVEPLECCLHFVRDDVNLAGFQGGGDS